MQYRSVKKGIFQARPNRFIAHVEVDGGLEVVHVKNTGRCRELLVPGGHGLSGGERQPGPQDQI